MAGFGIRARSTVAGATVCVAAAVLLATARPMGAADHLAAPAAEGTLPSAPQRTYSPAPAAVEPANLIDAGPLIAGFSRDRDVVFVDTRPATAFSRVRIPGSLNIPLFAVKTKSFLRGKTVVLLNEGFAVGPLTRECRAAAAAGFTSVRVLDGGLSQWAADGGPLEGQTAAVPDVRIVTPEALAAELGQRSFPVILVDGSDDAAALLPGARRVLYGAGGEGFLVRLEEALRGEAGARPTTVLLVDAAGGGPARLAFVAGAKRFRSGRFNFFVLERGLSGYEAYRARQIALLDASGKTTVGGCPTCPQGQSR